jgi:hypothetical protein
MAASLVLKMVGLTVVEMEQKLVDKTVIQWAAKSVAG